MILPRSGAQSFQIIDIPAGSPQLDDWMTSIVNRDGIEFTGNNGWSVQDNYSCYPGPCGPGYAAGSYYGKPYPPAAPAIGAKSPFAFLAQI